MIDLSSLQSTLDQLPDRNRAKAIVDLAVFVAWQHLFLIELQEAVKEIREKRLPDLERRQQTFSPKTVDTKGACELLGIGRTKLHELINDGLIRPEECHGKKNRFSVVHLNNYLGLSSHHINAMRDTSRLRKADAPSKAQQNRAPRHPSQRSNALRP
jgi:hypothetical protein